MAASTTLNYTYQGKEFQKILTERAVLSNETRREKRNQHKLGHDDRLATGANT